MQHVRLVTRAALAIVALIAVGCGSDSPTGPSGAGGVTVQGVVLGGDASVSAADLATSSAQAKKVKVRVEGTSLSVDVSANGTFEFTGLEGGTFTLIFLADDVEIGRIVVTAEDGAEVKLVVQVQDSTLILIELKVDGAEQDASDDTTSAACVVNGGKEGAGIELEGRVASGDSGQFGLSATGRSSMPIPVHTTGSTSFTCVGSTKAKTQDECKLLVKTGAQVHVSGTLNSCSTGDVTAREVKVQKG